MEKLVEKDPDLYESFQAIMSETQVLQAKKLVGSPPRRPSKREGERKEKQKELERDRERESTVVPAKRKRRPEKEREREKEVRDRDRNVAAKVSSRASSTLIEPFLTFCVLCDRNPEDMNVSATSARRQMR
jgi:hypothetical protein